MRLELFLRNYLPISEHRICFLYTIKTQLHPCRYPKPYASAETPFMCIPTYVPVETSSMHAI